MMMIAGDKFTFLLPPGKVLLVFPVEPGFDGARIEPEDSVLEAQFDSDAWRFPGRFYVLGGDLRVPKRWKAARSPATPEARRIADLYGVPVAACYSRPKKAA
jgi:hypothetical protein